MKTRRTIGLRTVAVAVAALCLGTLTPDAGAARLRVDRASTHGDPDGDSWPTAYKYIQDAIDEALDNQDEFDEIWVAGNEMPYYPDDRGSNGDRTLSFELHDKITIQGGYAGIGGAYDEERDIEDYETILSGNVGTGDADSYHVVTAIGVTNLAVLDGFTITGGYADGTTSLDRRRGGGIYIEDGWPAISNCTIKGNFAGTNDEASGGGGVGIKLVSLDPDPEAGETARFDDCLIVSNAAYEVGGGVFVGEDSGGDTGGVAFVRCTISDNDASQDVESCGGGVALWQITNDTVELEADFVNGRIQNNYTQMWGGGIVTKTHGVMHVRLANCLLTGNGVSPGEPLVDVESGGAIYNESAELGINACTFSDNRASVQGGAIYADDAWDRGTNITSLNSILYYNVDQEGGAEETLWVDDQMLTVDYCDVEGGRQGVGGSGNVIWGDHNIVAPPVFQGEGDFHLQIDSPCRDRGNTLGLPKDTFDLNDDADRNEKIPFDLDDRRRVIEPSVDMGAYEFVCPGDADGNDVVDFHDILAVLDGWGDCPVPPDPCPADLDRDGDVDFDDLLLILGSWDCGADGPGPSLSAIIVGMGLQWPDDWNEFLGWMDETTAVRENAVCWMDHYYFAHFLEVCLCSPSCPDDDPWGGHHSF